MENMKAVFIPVAILVFGLLIFVHELGHYIFARIFKVKIYEFSLGMGPSIISYTSKKTDIKYSISLLPIGGYVAMAGEDEDSDDPDSINRKPVWQRLIITVAGAAMNLALGIIIMFFVVKNTAIGTTVVADFLPMQDTGYTVTSEGVLHPYDEIIRVDGARVHTSAELDYEILHSGGGDVVMTVIRNGEKLDVIVPVPSIEEGGTAFGVRDFRIYAERDAGLGNTLKHTWYRSLSTVKMIWESLIDLITGRYGFEALSGPVGVTGVITDAAASDNGTLNVAYIAAVISMNLGVFNLLPVPALDGGRTVFLIIEGIRRKPLPQKFERYVNLTGLALLLLLTLVITCKDVFTLIRG